MATEWAFGPIAASRTGAYDFRPPLADVRRTEAEMLWILLVGLVAGFLARLIMPGPNNAMGFILTIVLGVAGAFLATLIGQTFGWYQPDQGAGFVAATLGAIALLFIWNRLVASGRLRDPGV
jgi:uncharacterized membrane protein YeaQ/YmgE (transglycosylase-associated protein family)